jgi:hypothetical protein
VPFHVLWPWHNPLRIWVLLAVTRGLAIAALKKDRLYGLVVRVPGYITEMYRDSCEVRTEFIYVM